MEKKELTPIDYEIINALENYEWEETSVLYQFARSINYSEAHTRSRLTNLVQTGILEKIADGVIKGKSRFIYRIKQQQQHV